jgi:phage terminase large subunit
MTTATISDVAAGARARARAKLTCAGSLREDVVAMLAESLGIRWPDSRYWERPVDFAQQILGMRVWAAQARILNAYVRHKRVSVRSGHKIGKSNTAAIIALHFYCSHPDARVVFTSSTARQVDAILWRELGKIRSRAGCCIECREACARDRRPEPRPCPHSSLIGGTMNTLARSGFRSEDFREISGFTARDAEAVAGISGANLLYLPDEASGIDDAIFEAIEGNRAGGARMVMFSNPTRTEGEFYRSHTDKALRFEKDGTPIVDDKGRPVGFYYAIQVSSEESPNVVHRRDVIPGLATHEWVEEKRAEWGVDSPLYKVRVLGEFVENEDGKILTVHALTEAERRWASTEARGRLHIGLDPAGPGNAGDESAFAIRRGLKIVELHARRGLTDDAHLVELLGILKTHRKEREQVPVVTLDREGPIGASLYGRLRDYADRHPEAFVVVGVRASDRAMRRGDLYERTRDELWANLADWIREGGAIPDDSRLAKELHAPEWHGQLSGKLKATPKSDLRRMLDGRSPDRADAVALAVWEAAILREEVPSGRAKPHMREPELLVEPDAGDAIDPYAALSPPWGVE